MSRWGEKKVRKTINHAGSRTRPQHVYIRLTEKARRRYNSIIGGFKHFMGPDATGADAFEEFGIPAMAEGLKRLAAAKLAERSSAISTGARAGGDAPAPRERAERSSAISTGAGRNGRATRERAEHKN